MPPGESRGPEERAGLSRGRRERGSFRPRRVCAWHCPSGEMAVRTPGGLCTERRQPHPGQVQGEHVRICVWVCAQQSPLNRGLTAQGWVRRPGSTCAESAEEQARGPGTRCPGLNPRVSHSRHVAVNSNLVPPRKGLGPTATPTAPVPSRGRLPCAGQETNSLGLTQLALVQPWIRISPFPRCRN